MNDPRVVYENRERWQILDVREAYEWEAGHIEEAIHVPLAEVMAGSEKGKIDPEKPVVVVCKTGNRSELAALMLQARGMDAQNLQGGAEAWVKAGLPIVATGGGPGKVM
jgi:rhodanese-related sulfurtransferase